jgi:hypothetical protein
MSEKNMLMRYKNMKDRCYQPTATSYKNYGGRGITVSDSWLGSFETFYMDMGNAPKGCSIDRIDNNKGYSKENCRWATKREQGNNQRTNKFITLDNGSEMTVANYARKFNITYGKAYNLIKEVKEVHDLLKPTHI